MRFLLIYDNEVYFKQYLDFKELKECLAIHLIDKISDLAIKELNNFKNIKELNNFIKILKIRKKLNIEILEF